MKKVKITMSNDYILLIPNVLEIISNNLELKSIELLKTIRGISTINKLIKEVQKGQASLQKKYMVKDKDGNYILEKDAKGEPIDGVYKLDPAYYVEYEKFLDAFEDKEIEVVEVSLKELQDLYKTKNLKDDLFNISFTKTVMTLDELGALKN